MLEKLQTGQTIICLPETSTDTLVAINCCSAGWKKAKTVLACLE